MKIPDNVANELEAVCGELTAVGDDYNQGYKDGIASTPPNPSLITSSTYMQGYKAGQWDRPGD